MPFNNQYQTNYYQPTTPTIQPSVAPQQVYTRFVTGDQDALNNIPQPPTGCNFGFDGENLVFYAKFADGHMEIYDMTLRQPPKAPEYVTKDDLSQMLDQKLSTMMDQLSNKFVIRKERTDRGGNPNG